MSYEIYKNVRVEKIFNQKQTGIRSSRAVSDPVYERGDYYVQVLVLSGSSREATFGDFKNSISQGDTVSIAINDKHDVIAVVNHSKKKEAKLERKKMKWDDIGGILFFLAFPVVLGGAIFWKSLRARGWDELTIGILLAIVVVVGLVLRGINLQYIESATALKKLR